MAIDRMRSSFLAAAIVGCAPERPAEHPPPTTVSTSAPMEAQPSFSPEEACAEIDAAFANAPCGGEGGGYAPLDLPKYCRRYAKSLLPDVAKRAIDCLARLDSYAICSQDRCAAFGCAVSALEQAPLDPATAPQCADADQACPGVASACDRYLAGMNDAARENVSRCLAEQCNGLFACLGFASYESLCLDDG